MASVAAADSQFFNYPAFTGYAGYHYPTSYINPYFIKPAEKKADEEKDDSKKVLSYAYPWATGFPYTAGYYPYTTGHYLAKRDADADADAFYPYMYNYGMHPYSYSYGYPYSYSHAAYTYAHPTVAHAVAPVAYYKKPVEKVYEAQSAPEVKHTVYQKRDADSQFVYNAAAYPFYNNYQYINPYFIKPAEMKSDEDKTDEKKVISYAFPYTTYGAHYTYPYAHYPYYAY